MHTSPGQIRRLINKNLLLQYKRLERLVFQQLLFRSLDSKLLNKYIKKYSHSAYVSQQWKKITAT